MALYKFDFNFLTLHCPSLGSIVIKERLTLRGQGQEPGLKFSKTSVDLKCKST